MKTMIMGVKGTWWNVDDDFIFEEDPRDNKMKYDVVSLNYKLSKLSI